METDYFCLTEIREQVRLRRPIRFNVEEFVFTTNRGLLTRGGERLLRIIDGPRDDSVAISLKRNPRLFGDILYYFRTGGGILFEQVLRDHESEKKGHLELLEAEASYWGIGDLCEVIQKLICKMNHEDTSLNIKANCNAAKKDGSVTVQEDNHVEDNILYDDVDEDEYGGEDGNAEQGEEDEQEDEEEDDNGIYVNAMEGRFDRGRRWTSRGL